MARGHEWDEGTLPFGCSKMPFSTPLFNALLKSESNMLSVAWMALLARTYFLRDCRLSDQISYRTWGECRDA